MNDPKHHHAKHFNKAAIIKSFDKAAITYDRGAAVQEVSGDRLLERCQILLLEPKTIVDLGCATGAMTRKLAKRYPQAKVTGIDFSEKMIEQARAKRPWFSKQHYCCADVEHLPFEDNSVDLLFSNMVMHWLPEPLNAWRELNRVLKADGALMFTMPGPDTLKEFRMSFAAVDNSEHVYPFIDMHDVGDHLLMAGFAEPVMDRQDFVMRYGEFKTLLNDLKMSGVTNKNPNRKKGLMGKERFQKMRTHYESFKTEDGKFPATYEIIYGHAFKTSASTNADTNQSQQIRDSEVRVAVDKIRRLK